jgi:hypothetical protein
MSLGVPFTLGHIVGVNIILRELLKTSLSTNSTIKNRDLLIFGRGF